MTELSTLIKQGRKKEIWTKYCGFFDLSIDEFMEIQERLLLEQIEELGKSLMGRMIMGDVIPSSIDEFRELFRLRPIRIMWAIWISSGKMYCLESQFPGVTHLVGQVSTNSNGSLTHKKCMIALGKL